MANSNKRPIVVFPIKKLGKIGDLILRVRAILLNVVNNVAIFATPNPTIALLTTNTTNLETAETLAKTRVAGSVGARNLKYDVLLKSVHGLQAYVQTLADNAVDEHTSISIINASGFDIKHKGIKIKPDLAAKNGVASGSIELVAKSVDKRSSSNWRNSLDNNTWTELPPTLQTKTTVIGLNPGSTVYFQHRAVTKTGAGNWSQSVSIVVQ
jgi:hypothetical protein